MYSYVSVCRLRPGGGGLGGLGDGGVRAVVRCQGLCLCVVLLYYCIYITVYITVFTLLFHRFVKYVGYFPHLYQDLALQTVGTGQLFGFSVEELSDIQLLLKDLLQVLSNLLLLLDTTVVFYGQNDWVSV